MTKNGVFRFFTNLSKLNGKGYHIRKEFYDRISFQNVQFLFKFKEGFFWIYYLVWLVFFGLSKD